MTVYMNRDGGIATCKNVYMNRDGGIADCKGVWMNYDGSNLRKVHAKIQTGTLENKEINFSKDGRDSVMTTTHTLSFTSSYVIRKVYWGKQWKNIDGNPTPSLLKVAMYGSTNGGTSWTLLGNFQIDQNYTGNTDKYSTVTISNTTRFNAFKCVFSHNGVTDANKRCNLYAKITEWE